MRLGEVALEQAPHARLEAPVSWLVIALPQPREDSEDARIALRRERPISPLERLAMARCRDVTVDHRPLDILGNVAPRVLQDRRQVVGRVPRRRALPKSPSSSSPFSRSRARISGALRPLPISHSATAMNGRGSSCGGGASIRTALRSPCTTRKYRRNDASPASGRISAPPQPQAARKSGACSGGFIRTNSF